MSAEDLQEMSRRLEKVRFVSERGYEPVFDEVLGEWMWIKCHYGSVHTLAGDLEEIARDERRAF